MRVIVLFVVLASLVLSGCGSVDWIYPKDDSLVSEANPSGDPELQDELDKFASAYETSIRDDRKKRNLAFEDTVSYAEMVAIFPTATAETYPENRVFIDTNQINDNFFQYDKYTVTDRASSKLNRAVEFLENNPLFHIEIQGHCDEWGTNSYNLSLGLKRAESVRRFLEYRGIDGDRIRVVSYGEEKPFCKWANGWCWYHNRRAHFEISGNALN